MLVCETLAEAAVALDGGRVSAEAMPAGAAGACAVAFMFPGQGAQHAGMAAEVYRGEPVFRDEVDRCAGLLRPQLGFDLRELLCPAAPGETDDERLRQTAIAQPALFVVEYALSRLWMSWGVQPEALIGHSLGEYVAACLAGVWTLEDALALVALRGALMQRQSEGGMLAVSLPESELRRRLPTELSLAAVNAPGQCVVSGPRAAITTLAEALSAQEIACHPLRTSHAFHSAMMEPAIEPLRARLRATECRRPTIPFVSNVTGAWIEPAQAADPEYWASHLARTVRFADGLDTLLQQPQRCLIEVGPGHTLAGLALRHPRRCATQTVASSLRRPQDPKPDPACLAEALGKVWLAGGRVDWDGYYAGQQRRRLPLPGYPFQRRRCWIDAPRGDAQATERRADRLDLDDWFHVASWQRTAAPAATPVAGCCWLLLMDACGVGAALAARLERRGARVVCVHSGADFARRGEAEFVVRPADRGDHERVLDALREIGGGPDVVVHLWNVTDIAASATDPAARDLGFHSLVSLTQALGAAHSCHIAIVSNRLHEVCGDEPLDPAKALLLGPAAVIPQEHSHLHCTSIDLDPRSRHIERHIEWLLADAAVPCADSPIAYRGAYRWAQTFARAPLPAVAPQLRPGGVYLVIGGTGGVGLALAEWLARTAPGARLALLARSAASLPAAAAARFEQLGAEVRVWRADVSCVEQTRRTLNEIDQQFGALHGVIHAAGLAGMSLSALTTRDGANRVLEAKVDGTLVLDALLAGAPLDFFVLCSSLTAIFGGAGQMAYAAANAFQAAWAQARAAQGQCIVSIDWDRWEGIGMAAAAEKRHRELTGADLPGGMRVDEATEVFGRVLAAAPAPRVVVSVRDIAAQRARMRGFQLETAGQPAAPHERPIGAGDYVGPADAIEQLIADIWQQELGIDRVGTRDDFFALGGDSLMAIRLTARLRQALAVPLDARELYDAPTVAALAEHVCAVRWAALAAHGRTATEPLEEGVL
jgi:acyl transferase domain-containing protein/acyl carrier protein